MNGTGRTGVPAIDRVIASALSRDAGSLARLTVLEDRECEEPGDVGAVLCPTGVPVGSTIQVFTFVSCHGEHVLENELQAGFMEWLSTTPTDGTADAANIELDGARRFGGIWRLVFVLDNGEARVLHTDSDGRIIYADRGCGPTDPADAFEGAIVIPPPEQ